ncbi:MAG: AAA family ATPase [Sedimentisphaerales bacterium]|nr:AAA family ATPase [Sedimentisphaerales bacterium]
MITKLSVSNFKSIRQLDIDCKKVNLFIGEPNTGKSNILESLALMSWWGHYKQNINDYIRFQAMQNLFYDQILDHEINISLSQSSGNSDANLYVSFLKDHFQIRTEPKTRLFATLDYQGKYVGGNVTRFAIDIRFFRFKNLSNYTDTTLGSLKPPDGSNLFSVVFGSEILRETVKEFFKKYGLRLVLKPQERLFELQKQTDDLIFSFPYALTSDTLRRIIFYTVAIASNKDSVLVFEEPESNSFPYYTKYLGERIALDETNQFFIATHNPYLLSAIIEKSRKEDVQVFITYFKDFQTHVKPLTANQLTELMESDPFFNIEHFIEDEE